MEHLLISIIVPIGICVVLPVLIVWFVTRARINRDNRRTELLLEAIRRNDHIDPEVLADALSKPECTERDRQHSRLLRGCLFGLIGFVCLVAAVVNGLLSGWYCDGFQVLGAIGGVLAAIGVAYLIVYRTSAKEADSQNEE